MVEQGKVAVQPTPLQMETQLLQAFPQYQKQLNELMPLIKTATGQYYVESLKSLSGILSQKDKFSSDIFTVLKTMVPVSKDAVRFLDGLNSIFNNPNIKKIDTPTINKLNEIIRLTDGIAEKDTEMAPFSIDIIFKDRKFAMEHLNFFYNTLTSTTKKVSNSSIKYLWNLVSGIEEFDTILVRNMFDHSIKRSGDLDSYLHAFVILGRRMPDENKIDDRYIERYCELVEYALTNVGKAGIYPVFSLFLNKRINPTNLDQVTKTTFRDMCHFVEEVQRKSGGDTGIELAYMISKFDPKEILKIPKQFKDNTKYAIKMMHSLIRADKSLVDAIAEVSKIIASKHSQLVMNLWLIISSSKKVSPAGIDHIIEFANALPDKLEQKVLDAILKMANAHIASGSFDISDFSKNYGTYLYTIARLVYKEKPNVDPAIFDLIGAVLQDSNLYRLDPNLLNRLYSLLPKLTKDNKTEIVAILGNSKLLEAKIDILLKILERKDANKLLLAFRKLTTSTNFEESALGLIEKGLGKKKLSEYLDLVLVVVDKKDTKGVLDRYGQLEKILAGFKIDKPEPEHCIYLYYVLKAVPEYENF